MAYNEDIIPNEPIQVTPTHLLFTFLDNWNLLTCFPGETTQRAVKEHHNSNTGEVQLDDFPPAIS